MASKFVEKHHKALKTKGKEEIGVPGKPKSLP